MPYNVERQLMVDIDRYTIGHINNLDLVPWIATDVKTGEPVFESLDRGSTWTDVPDWSPYYELKV